MGGTGPYTGGGEGEGKGRVALFSNPIENASEGQSKRSRGGRKKSEWNVTTEKCH